MRTWLAPLPSGRASLSPLVRVLAEARVVPLISSITCAQRESPPVIVCSRPSRPSVILPVRKCAHWNGKQPGVVSPSCQKAAAEDKPGGRGVNKQSQSRNHANTHLPPQSLVPLLNPSPPRLSHSLYRGEYAAGWGQLDAERVSLMSEFGSPTPCVAALSYQALQSGAGPERSLS